MAKSKNGSSNCPKPTRKKWPRGGSLKLWLECYLDSCERVSNLSKSAIQASVRLRQLAECGHEAQALKRLERLITLLDPTDVDSFIRLSLAGAEISLESLKLKRADKYIAALKARFANARPSKRKLLENFLHRFRLINGLAVETEDEADDEWEDEAASRSIGKQRHQFRLAILDGDEASALASVRRATKLIPDVDEFILERGLILSAIKAFQRLGRDEEITKYVTWIDRNGYTSDLDTGSLAAMGLVNIANARAEKLILRILKQLRDSDDPNTHFPVDAICSQLWFLIQTGESATAARLLKRVIRELPKWRGLQGGFSTSGSMTLLAEVVAELDGPNAAQALLGLAVEAGSKEAHRGFRKSAVKAAKEMIVAPGIAASIEKASSIGSARKRRETLVPLYAKSGNWEQLSTLLDQCSDADESHRLIHSLLYSLPGGARL
ncbi:hypothetical protein Poly51_47700 [Rubripirellula tenax]|uniref:Uncharacterized protein n=1 Tax=Rubripirellula tenax TaxID=2528015 RepID=A0A5C6EMT2_9BACT|nr:hypothetical protein [Rubripirellula tenax]TWU48866.1 hypothetical protein Poly51_47700 [Rubripirellula tenax]